MARRKSKVIRYRKPINFNIGMIVFLVFFIYILYNLGVYMTKEQPQIYEVGQVSSAVKDNTYDGLILRSESVSTTEKAGYINLYVRDSARASVGETVYSLDENGSYTELLKSNSTGISTLSSDQLDALKKKLAAYSASYTAVNFSNVYDAKYGVENLLMSYLSADSLENLADLGIDTTYLSTVAATESGVVEYMKDGMEDLKEEDLTKADFDRSDYQVETVNSGTMLEKGAFAYKTITSESWYVYLPLTEEDQTDLQDISKVYLHFNDVNLDVAAEFSMITTSDGVVLGKCQLSRYMIQLADRRYASVTLKKSSISELNKEGLKIPKTAVVSKEFYAIPEGYAAKDDDSDDIIFYRDVFTANGTQTEELHPTIYAHANGYYYLSTDEIEGGIVLHEPDNPVDDTTTDDLAAALAVSDEDPDNVLESTTAAETDENGDPVVETDENGDPVVETDENGDPVAETDENGDPVTETDENGDPVTETDENGDPVAETDENGDPVTETDENGDPIGDSSSDESSEEDSGEEEVYNPDMEMEASQETTQAQSQEAAASGEDSSDDSADDEAESTAQVVSTPQASGTFTVGETQGLDGVLSVNKGYALFKQITVLDETDDYYIVATGQSYGLSIYDHILLNGSSAAEGDLIY